jgi:hypothetical protein
MLQETYPPKRPATGRGAILPSSNEQVRHRRTLSLLLAVLKAPSQRLPAALAAALAKKLPNLDLNTATVRQLLADLGAEGLLACSGTGRLLEYSMTHAGLASLANAEFPPDFSVTLMGQAFNAVLEAARLVGKQFGGHGGQAHPEPSRLLAPTDLERAVTGAFEELLRERHGATGMVPVHEVRAEVRRRHGDQAARHDTFDPAVLRLRQAGALRLVPITDLSRATADQLQASLPGVGETLFFLEAAHEPVAS